MWLFIRHLIQLLLSPARGWEDVSEAALSPKELQSKGYYPLIGLTSLSEFLPLMYSHSEGFLHALEAAIAMAFSMFASLYLGRLFLEMTLGKFINGELNHTKTNIFVICMMGINCLFIILTNALPASMTFLRLLPLLSVIIIFKSTAYMGIKDDNQLNFTGLAIVGVIVIPISISSLLLFFI